MLESMTIKLRLRGWQRAVNQTDTHMFSIAAFAITYLQYSVDTKSFLTATMNGHKIMIASDDLWNAPKSSHRNKKNAFMDH